MRFSESNSAGTDQRRSISPTLLVQPHPTPMERPSSTASASKKACFQFGRNHRVGNPQAGTAESPRESGVNVDKTAAIALVGLVATVARFVDRVWSEANERLGFHQFFDDGRIVDVVDVVDDLRALVAHPTVVFELRRTMHFFIVDGREPTAVL